MKVDHALWQPLKRAARGKNKCKTNCSKNGNAGKIIIDPVMLNAEPE